MNFNYKDSLVTMKNKKSLKALATHCNPPDILSKDICHEYKMVKPFRYLHVSFHFCIFFSLDFCF